MRAAVSWVAEHVDLPAELTARELGEALVRVGLEVERVDSAADGISGPIVVGRVLSIEELTEFKKPIRFCQVDVGESEPRGIVCGARNFAQGDLVVAALPGAVLPGPFPIAARKTYGRVSDGMLCSARELGLGDDHSGILVLASEPRESGEPDGRAELAIGVDALAVLGMREPVLDIAVTPDRSYCLSVRGLAREAAAALDRPFSDITAQVPGPDDAGYPARVDDPESSPKFSLRMVSGLDPARPTPDFIVRRLRSSGMRSISLTVDVTNYVMLETGQPLHAYDRNLLRGPIGVRGAQAGEKLTTLDGVTRELDPDDLVIVDDRGPIGLAGVMGGAATEISALTTDVVLEGAYFAPARISRAVRRHKLPSEAAKRFERGVDPEIAAVALQRCVDLLVQHGGARPVDGFTVIGAGPAPVQIVLPAARPAELAGMPIEAAAVRDRLQQVGCTVESEDGLFRVTPPTWRPDLTDPADLIEEVIRLEGYDKVPSVLLRAPAGRGWTPGQLLRRQVSRALAYAGYTEVINYPFVSPAVHEQFGLAADDPRRAAFTLANPISDAEPELRTSLLPGLVANLQRNLGRGSRDLAVFEMGLVFLAAESGGRSPRPNVAQRPTDEELAAISATVPRQPRHLAVALAGDKQLPGWWGGGRAGGWADAIEAARIVARAARTELEIVRGDVAPWHPGRCAELRVHGEVIGAAGELHPRVIAALGLPARTSALELDLDALGVPKPAQAPSLSNFPPVLLDLALVVSEQVPAEEVRAAVAAGAGVLLESVRLFDVYTDADRLGPGLKSLAFALKFRADDRTLTIEEATLARDAAIAEAQQRVGARLRA
ncbi:MAG TPA: phenylalanine--tRNA ligase subunit beta [Jatrophihabitans sp.]|nr:phenylalanine--tRNA ligase subunit beta [Jatrophihabitans sp.]